MEQQLIKDILNNPLINEYFDDQHLGSESAIGFAGNIISKYFPRENIYHSGIHHIWPMLEYFSRDDSKAEHYESHCENQFVGYFFALFHDALPSIVECRRLLNQYVNMNGSNKFRRLFEMVHEAIQASAYEFENIDNLPAHAKYCIMADVGALLETDYDEIVKSEQLIFKEYQKYDYPEFVRQRTIVLENIYRICNLREECLELRKLYLECFTPRIAVFAGSFNPFHVGHMNVLKQAEKHFHKVIVAVGQNADKADSTNEIAVKDKLKYHQVESYSGLLTDYIKRKSYPVTLIRGLRNGQDLQYEQNMRSALQDLKSDVQIVYYLCDRDVAHISSSLCRDVKSSAYTDFPEYARKY